MRRLILPAALAAVLVLAGTPSARAAGTPVLVVVGDSISVPWGLPTGQGWAYTTAERRLGAQPAVRVSAIAGRCLVATGCGYDPPIAATWQADVVNALPRPTTVLLEAGTNDLQRLAAGWTVAQIETGFQQLVAQAQAAGIRVIVGTITPRDQSQWTTYWWWGPQRAEINTWIRATFGPDVADFDTALTRPDGWCDPRYLLPSDPIHPNEWGHIRMSRAVPVDRII